MKALSISRLLGWLNMAERRLFNGHQSGIWLQESRTSESPQRTIRKRGDWLMHGLQPSSGWLALQRPSGTSREPASTRDERRWPIVSCYWGTTHGVCIFVRVWVSEWVMGEGGRGSLKYKGKPLKARRSVLWPCFKAKGDTCHVCSYCMTII